MIVVRMLQNVMTEFASPSFFFSVKKVCSFMSCELSAGKMMKFLKNPSSS